jgi:molybdopterin-guanine dinucleotide biosynthesis protein A
MKLDNIDKSWEKVNQIPMIIKPIQAASAITKNIVLSVANPVQLKNIKNKLSVALPEDWDLNISFIIDNPDIIPQGPLRGALSALDAVKTRYAIIQPVDMPLVESKDLQRLISGMVSFSTDMASYSILDHWVTTLLYVIDIQNTRSILHKLKNIHVSRSSSIFRAMPSVVLFRCSSTLNQLYNVNTPKDLRALKDCPRIDNFSHEIFNGYPNFFSIQHWVNTPPDDLESVIEAGRKELEIWKIKKMQLDVLQDIRRIIGSHHFEILGFLKQESEIYRSLGLNK